MFYSPSEFELYTIQDESAITFSLKEFRSFLLFAENIGETVTLNFNEAGGPIFLSIKKMDFIECALVMTTVYPEDISMYEDCIESELNVPSSPTDRCSMPPPQKRKHSNPKANATKDPTSKKRLSEETTLSNNSTLFQFNTDNNTTMHSDDGLRNLTQQDIDMDDEQDDIILAAAVEADTTLSDASTRLPPARQSEVFVTFQSTESNNPLADRDDDDDSIPQSPQREHVPKLRLIFSRCFESTYRPREPSPSSQIFVPNSDTED